MAMGKRRKKQGGLFVLAEDLPKSPGHPFYGRLNELLEKAGFDRYVESRCRKFYAAKLGRPSMAPGMYFRVVLMGYFEGLESERGMSWRASDSLALRSFLGLSLNEGTPDHSTISRTRRLIDVETHSEVFSWVLSRLSETGLVDGKTIGIDATTLEANAAMRSIVRRDTGESYTDFLKGLAKASGIKTPTRAAMVRLDRMRKKKGSNAEWMSESDPDSRIAKMKDGRTRLGHKAEQAVDMKTGAIVAVTIQGADQGDTTTIETTVREAQAQIERIHGDAKLKKVVTDKGYHSTAVLESLDAQGLQAYVSVPMQHRRKWRGDLNARRTVYANRRRSQGKYGQTLQKLRGERCERPFAHMYRTGGLRRTQVRGHENVLKRVLVHSSAFNLSLLMRTICGVGTPRSLQGRIRAVLAALASLSSTLERFLRPRRDVRGFSRQLVDQRIDDVMTPAKVAFTTGC